MERTLTSMAMDRRTARPVFRSFLDGVILLALLAILLTVQITPSDPAGARAGAAEPQPAHASIFPSIVSAHRQALSEPAVQVRTCDSRLPA